MTGAPPTAPPNRASRLRIALGLDDPREAAALALILAVAAVLRLWRLGDVPFGFHPDEGHNALDAIDIAKGWRPVFLPGNNGREALFMYPMALLVHVFGPTIAAVRLTAVIAGLATVKTQWWMVRAFPLERARRVALISAAFVAVSFWPVAQSRYALRASLLPMWVALMIWAWWKAIGGERVRLIPAAAAGLFVGLAGLTHLTGRVLLVALAASALGELFARRGLRALTAWAVAAAVAFAVLSPQLAYFAGQPEMLTYRSEQVSLLNPAVNEGDPARALVENVAGLLAAPVTHGDGSWYHNLSGRPVFDPVSATLFVAGVILLVAGLFGLRKTDTAMESPATTTPAGSPITANRRMAWLLVATLAVTAAPSALSEGAPNYVRLTGVIPVLFLMPALGLDALAAAVDRFLDRGLAWEPEAAASTDTVLSPDRRRTRSGTGGVLIAGVLLLATATTARDYFGRYARAPQAYEAFNGAAVERGYLLRDVIGEASGPLRAGSGTGITPPEASRTVYVTPAIWKQSVIRFLNHEAPPRSFDLRAGLVLPPEGSATYAFDPVEADDAGVFGAAWPIAVRSDVLDGRGEVSLILFRLERAQWPGIDPSDRSTVLARFGDSVELVHLGIDATVADIASPNRRAQPIRVEWRAVAPTVLDHNLFVQVAAADGTPLGQWDGPPLAGSYGTNVWMSGERVLQTILVPIDEAPEGRDPTPPHTLRLGWYDWRTGERLSVPNSPENAYVVVPAVDTGDRTAP